MVKVLNANGVARLLTVHMGGEQGVVGQQSNQVDIYLSKDPPGDIESALRTKEDGRRAGRSIEIRGPTLE